MKLSENLIQQLSYFVAQHPTRPFSAMLRHVLLTYMSQRMKTGFHPGFGNFLQAMEDLFQLLDTAAAEQK